MASFSIEFEQGGELQQMSFQSESISVGRDRSSDFILDHPTVSRQHALIVHQGGGHFALVVISRGGLTALDGTPVESAEVQLYDGSAITLGKYTVRFRSHQAPPRPQGGMADLGAFASFDDGPGVAAPEKDENFDEPEPEPEPEPKKDGGPGIMSWDEIAAGSEEDEKQEAEQEPSNFQRIQEAKKDDEGSNPIVIVGALLGAGLLLLVALSGGSSGSSTSGGGGSAVEEDEPVSISVSCIDPSACEQDAEHNYQRAIDLIEQRAIETGNLFEGYERLLLAEAYLKEAGIDEIPAEMDQWHELHDMAREELDSRFSDLRMRFHQAAQRNQHREMASVLNEIQAYFPERTARENRWARNQESRMKSEGSYPRN